MPAALSLCQLQVKVWTPRLQFTLAVASVCSPLGGLHVFPPGTAVRDIAQRLCEVQFWPAAGQRHLSWDSLWCGHRSRPPTPQGACEPPNTQ